MLNEKGVMTDIFAIVAFLPSVCYSVDKLLGEFDYSWYHYLVIN